MDLRRDTTIEAVLEQLSATGATDPGRAYSQLFESALQVERVLYLKAGNYERTPGRQGCANGYRPGRIDTPAGTIALQMPRTAGHEGEPFYPQPPERGQRSLRAVMPAVAEMYIRGVSKRQFQRSGCVIPEYCDQPAQSVMPCLKTASDISFRFI